MNIKRKAIFLDRDGVINDLVDRGDNFSITGRMVRFTAPYFLNEFKLKDGVVDGLKSAGEGGFLRIIVTNQPDVRYGVMSEKEYDLIIEETRRLPVDDVYICRHGRDDGCNCRKPKTGMFIEADKKWDIDFTSSFIIGDSDTDIIAGKNIGLKTILVKTSYNDGVEADFYVNNLKEAIDLITNNT